MPRYLTINNSDARLTQKKPDWLKMKIPKSGEFSKVRRSVSTLGLTTVCEEALCPNIGECWEGGTATIMLMGRKCTRACKFCYVESGSPKEMLDPSEPFKVAKAISEWGINYVVLTSVDRDDIIDGGASHFALTVNAIKKEDSNVLVEVLIPDFEGDLRCIKKIVDSLPEVISHNIETTEYLTPKVRDRRAGYHQSLQVLRIAKKMDSSRYTKSSIMLGLGETEEETCRTMLDLRLVGVDFLTIGQYLQPSSKHLPVKEYISPSKFEHYRSLGEEMGFLYVVAGPLIRSSYRAGEFFIENIIRRDKQTKE